MYFIHLFFIKLTIVRCVNLLPPPDDVLFLRTARVIYVEHHKFTEALSRHRLFISAFMISSKVMCDDTYSNKSWSVVAQGMFNLREISQMEREICNYLELTAANPMLSTFETAVKKDFREQKPVYPSYPTSFVSKRAARAEASTCYPSG